MLESTIAHFLNVSLWLQLCRAFQAYCIHYARFIIELQTEHASKACRERTTCRQMNSLASKNSSLLVFPWFLCSIEVAAFWAPGTWLGKLIGDDERWDINLTYLLNQSPSSKRRKEGWEYSWMQLVAGAIPAHFCIVVYDPLIRWSALSSAWVIIY